MVNFVGTSLCVRVRTSFPLKMKPAVSPKQFVRRHTKGRIITMVETKNADSMDV